MAGTTALEDGRTPAVHLIALYSPWGMGQIATEHGRVKKTPPAQVWVKTSWGRILGRSEQATRCRPPDGPPEVGALILSGVACANCRRRTFSDRIETQVIGGP